MKAELITPDGRVYYGDAKAVQVPGSEGSFQILKNHAPIVSTLTKGRVKIEAHLGTKYFMIDGGVVEVLNNNITIMAQRIVG